MHYNPDVFNKDCPSQKVLAQVANRWAALIICALHEQKIMRNGQLLKKVGGINQKMLTQTLRSLENNGLVTRKIYSSIPPKVEYSLTKLGDSLYRPLDDICRWTEMHLEELKSLWKKQKV